MPRDVGVRVHARQARSAATLERILEAAGGLFDEVGVDATTMDAIADRAGVSIGSVYRFFENKTALKTTLSARWADHLRQAVEPHPIGDTTPAAGLRAGRHAPPPAGADGADDADPMAGIDKSVARFVTALRQVLDELPGAKGLLATTLREPPGETGPWITYLDGYIAHYAPNLPAERRATATHAYLTITAALILSAVSAGPALDRHLDEVRTVLAGYTRELARESAAARAG
ncbi:TetR/AcrR family transcriptional regulator [Pseudofrankia inefficax]|uniref:Regulatory protein TetR n=1 Tax=Pseudofrankia inefficax (strain DSM 45817 / CECT 9037 / DDB 130130 / EuI1c) TaxID=298654 RepID=E3J485_PSEI1|nr:TetR/AcrR family transcriptional regulator [Pseudofrankia inefficax]ADP81864.1 regulatory protein TetR [Pseudofrankia inefficax]